MNFIDSMYALKKAAMAPDMEESDFAAFTASAQGWLAASPKPKMPDDALTFRLVAEDAYKRKDFTAALDAYSDALSKYPMWPEGHYNAALLAAEADDFELASRHMRRYLVLSPDAKDAASAKEKFLLWQHKANPDGASASSIVYDPKSGAVDQVPRQMDVFEAKEIVDRNFKGKTITVVLDDAGKTAKLEFFSDSKMISTKQGRKEYEYVYGSGQRLVVIMGKVTITNTYTDGRPPQVRQGVPVFFVRNEPSTVHSLASFEIKDDAIQLVDAVLRLENYFTTDRIPAINAELERFQPIADGYRAQNPRPTIPEDARKYQVQAESALAEKKYDDAIRLFRKALELSPWWPEGHFSLALLYEQQEFLPHAYLEMKKYLALVPDAVDARKAKDKLYVWELKMESAKKRTP